MELKDYTTKELQEELKRRIALAKEQKARELEQEERCRNCKHCIIQKPLGIPFYYCGAKTWSTKSGRTYNYSVKPSTKCKFNLFEHK